MAISSLYSLWPRRLRARLSSYSLTLCTIWIPLILLSPHLPRTRSQIDDIILDLQNPDDYVDRVVDNMEQEQDDRDRLQVETAARCRVRCLTERQIKQKYSGQNAASLDRCLKDDDCTACMKPCSQPFINLVFCENICESDPSGWCRESCIYLQQLYTQKPGHCPSINQLTGYGALCIEACLVDSDCPEEDQKCCYNGCGHMCVQPLHDLTGLPLIPDEPQLSELRPEGSVLLEWNSVATNTTGPVLYIIWVRWNIGKHHSDTHSTHWQQITQTTDITTVVKDTRPGYWYQYQVAAVNINGSRGISDPTRVFSLADEPSSPSAPINLTEGEARIQNNHVTISIQWKHPVTSDLPITRYKIFWSKKENEQPNSPAEDMEEHRQVIPGDRLHFDVPDLDPDCTYLIQVQAICQYGEARLKSGKALIYVNTAPLSGAAHVVQATTTVLVDTVALITPRPLLMPQVKSPFFQNGLLRANVSWSVAQDGSGISDAKALLNWSPDACITDNKLDHGLPKVLTAITQDQHFVIYELRYDCRYVVRVMPISDHGTIGEETRMTFVTPSCGEVEVVGRVQPDCPISVPRIPEDPANLQYSFIIHSVNISAHLTWDPPLSDTPVTGYRVTWGQTLPGHSDVWDKNTVLTKVLQKDANNFQLQNLCEAVTYLFRIQALSRLGPGKVATLHFTAPVLTFTTSNVDTSSNKLASYEILNLPPESDDDHDMNDPNTSKSYSWTTSSSTALSASSNIRYRVCGVYCIRVNMLLAAFYHLLMLYH